MTSHFRFHDAMATAVPPSAQYQFPTQANRAWKSLMKIPPKNGNTFRSDQAGAPIRIELPAQGYLNTARSHLSFDVGINVPATETWCNIRFQNNIQSVFRRMRLVYGSLPLEDIRESNVLVRMLTEATGTNTLATSDQTSITEGIGGFDVGNMHTDNNNSWGVTKYETRLWKIQNGAPHATHNITHPPALRAISTPLGGPTQYRRYTIQLPFGLFQQPKLLPLKWMASQLTIELELAAVAECMAAEIGTRSPPAPQFTFELSNITFNAELHEFDAAYDAAFLEGLSSASGVPIGFASWNTYINTPSGSTSQNLLIPERNRSIKSIFNILLPPAHIGVPLERIVDSSCYAFDSHAMLGSCQWVPPGGLIPFGRSQGHQQHYQFRLGGKQFPAQPVNNGSAPNGGAESYCEFQKALNIVGDYSLSTAIDSERWMALIPPSLDPHENGATSQALDFHRSDSATNNAYTARPPSMYVTSINLETSNGSEISGLNGEEQNDIALTMEYSAPQPTSGGRFVTFVYYDALLILRKDNIVELIK